MISDLDLNLQSICIISDIHSCFNEFSNLLEKLGFHKTYPDGKWVSLHGDVLISVGDTIDRGPDPISCLKTMMELCEQGLAYEVRSNHNDKLRRYLRDDLNNQPVKVKIGKTFSETLLAVNNEGLEFKQKLYKFLDSLPYIIKVNTSAGLAVVCHAAYVPHKKEKIMHELALVGETNGEKDKDGYPIRTYEWINKYSGPATWICHGHDIFKKPKLTVGKSQVRVWSIDTGCYKSGVLTALRLPSEGIIQSEIFDKLTYRSFD